MKHYQLPLVASLPVANTLGEGILWKPGTSEVWWLDIQESLLYRHHFPDGETEQIPLPERAGSFAFTDNDDLLVVAFASGMALFNLATKQVTWLAKPERDIQGNRFNDGRTDPCGNFWAGTMVEQEQLSGQPGSLYRLDSGYNCRAMLGDIAISNGLCWSPDGRTLYHSDSPLRQIHQYDFNRDSGDISNRRLFAETPQGSHPDGAITDNEGYLYSAQWGAGSITRFHPDGSMDGFIPIPVSQPTCLCFGGENMDLIFVSSARDELTAEQLKQQPQAGNVLVYQSDFKGRTEPLFKLDDS